MGAHFKYLPKDIPDWAGPLFPFNGGWGPVIDGTSDGLPDWPEKMIEAGNFNKVPLITGGNVNGGALIGWALPLLWGDLMFPLGGGGPVRESDFTKFAKWFIPKPADQTRFMELYGGSDWPFSAWTIDRIDRFFRDALFLCPARETSTLWSSHGQPVYDYVFNYNMHTNITGIIHALTATHGFELPFVFRNLLHLEHIFSPRSHRREWEDMSDVMSCTWASFVRCQKPKCSDPPPNCAGVLGRVPEWPAFSPTQREYISFQQPTSTIETLKSHTTFPNDEFPGDDRCDFWKTQPLGFQSIRQRLSSQFGIGASSLSESVTLV